eukprot:GILI01006096.1.p1 GENE.GILI01006096.1~~GILI01006096.1.p1  ORF type:complete len:1543 (-),score=316.18 GILI01006096.1:112-4290(-)
MWISKIVRSVEDVLAVPQPREKLMTSSSAEKSATATSTCFPNQRQVAIERVPVGYEEMIAPYNVSKAGTAATAPTYSPNATTSYTAFNGSGSPQSQDFLDRIGNATDLDDVMGPYPHLYDGNNTLLFTNRSDTFSVDVIDGLAQFVNISLAYPVGGLYTIEVSIECSDQLNAGEDASIERCNESDYYNWRATMRVHILPGKPISLCVWSSFAGAYAQRDGTVSPNPRLLMLDAANNVFQPTRRESRLSANGFFDAFNFESFAESLIVLTSVQKRSYDFRFPADAGSVWDIVSQDVPNGDLPPVTTTDPSVVSYTSPSAEYSEDNSVGVMQLQFRSVSLMALYGNQYRFVFNSPQLVAERQRLYGRQNTSALRGFEPMDINVPPSAADLSTAIPTSTLLLTDCNSNELAVKDTTSCITCPSGASYCHGGLSSTCFICNGSTSMALTGNYWRYDWYSLDAYDCPAESCIGGGDLGSANCNTSEPATCYAATQELTECREGYRHGSAMCDECVDGYAKDLVGSCSKCPPAWANALLVLFIAILAAVVLVAFTLLSIKEMDGEESDDSIVMTAKIFVNFVQVTSMLGEFKVNFPAFVLSYFDFIAASSGSSGVSINPVNCLLPSLTFLEMMDIQLALPIVILCGIGLVLVWQNHLRNRKRERQLRPVLTEDLTVNPKTGRILDNPMLIDARRSLKMERPLLQVFGNASMIILFLTYQSIAAQCIKIFNCIQINKSDVPGDYIRLLVQDTRVQCRGDNYEAHMGIAAYGLVGYGFVMPALAILFVLRVATYQGWSAATMQFGFLIKGFRLRFWWWEMVIVFRKIFILLLLAVVEDSVLQALLGIWFLTLTFVVQSFARPYIRHLHNMGEQLSLMTALITLNIGLAFRTQEADSGVRCGSVCKGFSVLLIILNVVTILVFLIFLVSDAYDRLVEMYGVDSAYGTRWFSVRNVKNHIISIVLADKRQTPNFSKYTPKFVDDDLAIAVFGALPNTNPRKAITKTSADKDTDADTDGDADEAAAAQFLEEEPDIIVRYPNGQINLGATLTKKTWKQRVLDGMLVDTDGNVMLKKPKVDIKGGDHHGSLFGGRWWSKASSKMMGGGGDSEFIFIDENAVSPEREASTEQSRHNSQHPGDPVRPVDGSQEEDHPLQTEQSLITSASEAIIRAIMFRNNTASNSYWRKDARRNTTNRNSNKHFADGPAELMMQDTMGEYGHEFEMIEAEDTEKVSHQSSQATASADNDRTRADSLNISKGKKKAPAGAAVADDLPISRPNFSPKEGAYSSRPYSPPTALLLNSEPNSSNNLAAVSGGTRRESVKASSSRRPSNGPVGAEATTAHVLPPQRRRKGTRGSDTYVDPQPQPNEEVEAHVPPPLMLRSDDVQADTDVAEDYEANPGAF